MRTSSPGIDWAWLGRLAPRVAIGGALLGWALTVLVSAGGSQSSQPWGGDYPAFQTAGRMVLDGRYGELYDFKVQDEYQEGMPREGLLPYLYPPVVAAMYAPLAMLPYRASYALFTLLSLGALVAAVLVMRPLSAAIRDDPWCAVALTLLFYPMWRAVLGGQNTSFSLLILCGFWRLMHEDRRFLAGLVLGLLSYKPQLLVPIGGIVLLSGHYRASFGAAVSAIGLFCACSALAGWGWPVAWLQMLQMYTNADRQFNAFSSISLGRLTDLFGWANGWVLLSVPLSLWAAWTAYSRGRADFFAVLAIAITASLLIPPHAMFYDVGIVLPALLLLADRGYVREAALLWIAGFSQFLAPALPVSPIIAMLLATLLVLRRGIRG